MIDQTSQEFLEDSAFQILLVECLERLERGESLDREALLREHPQFAEPLEEFLADQALLKEVASGVRDSLGRSPAQPPVDRLHDETIDSSPKAGGDFSAGESIRYVGEYEILEEIARGGMGVVFKARQQKLGRVVALKMILAGKLADDADIERFHREARAAGRLKHPNIVPVHEIGEHEGRHYFTMDFVDGRSLAEELREETLAPQRAAEIVRTVAEAVQFAHDQGTVHRDLKPANVLLTADGEPHITDFGLAKMLESVDEQSRAELTATGQILGTPSYMSPEQASGKQELVGPASDIYSLGAILYACLTGRAPFVADSPVDTLLQVMKKEPVSPRELNPSVPRDLETICLKCLTKEPHKRYGTAQELADDLNRFLEGRPVVARPVGPVSRTIRWCRRNSIVASLLTLVFLSMAVGTAVSVFYANSARNLAESEASQRREADAARSDAEAQRDTANRALLLAEQRGADLRRQLYIAQMPRALEAWNDGNTARVKRLLEQHVPADGAEDLRGFEWHYLKGLTESSRLTIDTGRTIAGANISHDGQMIASIGQGTLLIHNLDDGSIRAEFPVRRHGDIAGIAFDSTGTKLCVDSHRVRLWSLPENRVLWELDSPIGCGWCAFTPDDSQIVSTSNNWEPGTAQIHVRAADSGALLNTIPVPTLVWSATLDGSGRSIYVACKDSMLRQWDLTSGTLLREWPCRSVACAMTWDATGRYLLLGNGDGYLERHDTIAGERTDDFGRHRTSFMDISVNDTGAYFAAVGRSQLVHVFDAATGNTVKEFRGHSDEILAVDYRPGNQEVVTADRAGVVQVWSLPSEQGVLDVECRNTDVAVTDFSPNGRWFVYCEGIPWARERKGTVRLFDLENQIPGPTLDGHTQGVFGLAVSDKLIYSAGEDGQLIAWDTNSHEPAASRSFGVPLRSLAVSDDDQVLVVGFENGNFVVLDDVNADQISEFHVGGNHQEVQSVAVSQDGRLIAAASRTELRVLDRERDTTVLNVRLKLIRSIAFDSTGHWLAVVNDGHVNIYDTTNWQIIHEIRADSQPVAGIAFHPASGQLATRSIGGLLNLWETESWQNVLTVSLPDGSYNDQHNPTFSPDGRYLVASRHHTALRLLCTEQPHAGPQPLDIETLRRRAESYISQQKWPEAFEAFEAVIAAGTEHPWDHVHAAEVAALLEPTLETAHRIREAVKLAELVADENPDVAARLILPAQLIPNADPAPAATLKVAQQAWKSRGDGTIYALAYTMFRQRRDEDLIEHIRTNRGPQNSSMTISLPYSGALYRLGQIEEANALFDKTADRYGNMPPIGRGRNLDLNGFNGVIWNQLLFREVSDIALAALDEAIIEQPDRASLFAYRGLLHRRWHRWSEGLKDLRKACELEPDNAEYAKAAAICATLANQYDEADRLIQQSIRLYRESNNSDSFWSVARIASRIPNAASIDNQLLAETQASANRQPSHSWRRLTIVGVLHRLGQHEQALKLLKQIEDENPDFSHIDKAAIQVRRGLILHDQGKLEDARRALMLGELLGRISEQPPGIFPKRGQETVLDYLTLRRELANLLDGDEKKPQNDVLLLGDWRQERLLRGGLTQTEGVNHSPIVTFRDSSVTIPGFGPDTFAYRTEKANSASEPGRIDFTARVNNTSHEFKGLYEVKGNTLTLVINEWPDGPRPTTLTPTEPEQPQAPASHRLYVVLQRLENVVPESGAPEPKDLGERQRPPRGSINSVSDVRQSRNEAQPTPGTE